MAGIRQLGGVVLPAVTVNQGRDSRTQAQTIAQTGRLGSDETTVDQLTTEPPGTEIRGVFEPNTVPKDRVQMVARELDELGGSGRGPLPLFDTDSATEFGRRGFYSISDVTVEPAQPTRPDVQPFRVSLDRAGTRRDSYRAVALNPVSISTPFDGSDPPGVYTSAAAGKSMWLDRADETSQSASSVSSSTSARGTVERYDPPTGLDRPALVYDIPEVDDVPAVVVFDTRGNDDKLDSDDIRQWRAVYSTSHEFVGDVVLSSGRLRITISEGQGGAIGAEEYTSGSWSTVALGATSWYVLDVDLLALGQHRAVAQLRFRQSGEPDYVVELSLDYGREAILITPAPDESDPIPNGIVNLFIPIASGRDTDPQPARTLLSREVLRR